jgi:NADH-ubiquinone oxidoreductase chain 1
MINNNLLSNLYNILFNLLDVLVIILPVLLAVAFMTIIERKQLAAMQRRVGPNTVGGKNLKIIC